MQVVLSMVLITRLILDVRDALWVHTHVQESVDSTCRKKRRERGHPLVDCFYIHPAMLQKKLKIG